MTEFPPQPDLSIVIVVYNGRDDLLRCLAALEKVRHDLPFEVIVVDNASTDGGLEAAQAQFPGFSYIRSVKNIGFAAGCNLGLSRARGRHAMLLNPDTEVLPRALSELVSALDRHPGWGIVGPRMVDGRNQPYRAARRLPTPFYLFCECTRLVYLFPRISPFGDYFYGDLELELLDSVEQIEGSALVISEAARRKIGPLDEGFFLFFEEVDWCKRVLKAGFEIHVVNTATVRHHRSTSMSRNYVQAREANARSALHYFGKHFGFRGTQSLIHWMSAGLWIREILSWMVSHFDRSGRAKLRADGARAERAIYRQAKQDIH